MAKDSEMQFSDNEVKIINYLKEYESITNKEAREATGLSSSGVRKVFEGLTHKKIIIALGNKKSRYYKLNLSESKSVLSAFFPSR